MADLRLACGGGSSGGVCAGRGVLRLCSADRLLEMNRQYLGHDYFTDVITFDYRSDRRGARMVSGDVFIDVGDGGRQRPPIRCDPARRDAARGRARTAAPVRTEGQNPRANAVMHRKEDRYLHLLDAMLRGTFPQTAQRIEARHSGGCSLGPAGCFRDAFPVGRTGFGGQRNGLHFSSRWWRIIRHGNARLRADCGDECRRGTRNVP
ncbi:MAG: hypothetical protein ACLS37_13850 [Alistipes sp.]